MQKLLLCAVSALTLAGCSNATRTVIVPTVEERTISGERAPLVVPPINQRTFLPIPKDDPVIKEWKQNNFAGTTDRSATLVKPKEMRPAPVPPRRPCSAGNTSGCDRAK
jgi:hypothetical protein